MPTSNIDLVPIIIKILTNLKPKSILDFGIGFGKYGFLLREYLDVHKLENGFAGRLSENFTTKIDGIEICDKYISEVQKGIYDQIFIGNGLEIIDKLDKYEVVLLLDVIEHFDKKEGYRLLAKILQKKIKACIISTPAFNYKQGNFYTNDYETHKSFWQIKDFNRYIYKQHKIFGGQIMLIVIHENNLKIKIPSLREGWSGRYLLKEVWNIILELLPKVVLKLRFLMGRLIKS